MFSLHCITFFLPEYVKDEALLVTYSNRHKLNSALAIESILCQHGYTDYHRKNQSDGDIIFTFANENKIHLMSLETNRLEQLLDKCKNVTLGNVKFVVYEELTATLTVFRGDLYKFYNAKSSFNRFMNENTVEIYNYNPPENRRHSIYDWANQNRDDMLNIHTTIYDLPAKWQNSVDLKEAAKLKKFNPDRFAHQYLGIPSSTDGLAFSFDESIWVNRADDYIEYYIQTDEATLNATTFALFGVTSNYQIHMITLYYHSSKDDGVMKSMHKYGLLFQKWYDALNLDKPYERLTTDSLAFAAQLRELGFKDARHMGGLKDRTLSYTLLNQIILDNTFKIVNVPENIIAYEQLANAELEYNQEGKPRVSKAKEASLDNKYHFHAGDTILYLCLQLQKRILRGDIR